ncbi:MAG TPA: FAD-dependent monooxygenase [Thermoanaerobaculia bacterium]|nr:FAD-dependent monooxygenase [Thermoanaerobaculia bacterium]
MSHADAFPLLEATDLDRDDQPEVLVVGAGPVGLFAAVRLAERGIRVQIVDEERRPAARSYALALHPASLGLLAEAGLASAVLDQGHRLESLAFYEGRERRALLDFAALPGRFPFVTVLPQQSLEGILESRLEELGVRVLWNHRLAGLKLRIGGGAVAEVERLSRGGGAVEETFGVRPGFVIGADGHRSAVRRALALEFPEVGPAELYAVFEISSAEDAGHEVRVVMDGAASVLWPIGRERFRWSFQIADWEGFVEPRFKNRRFGEVGEEPFPYLVKERLTELIRERAPWFSGAEGEVIWSAAVRFERRLAGRFGRESAWLAGDSAHLAGPIGNHSLNVGLREAEELASRLERILREGAPAGLLEEYGHEAHTEWRRLLGLKGAPIPGEETSPWVRRNAGRLLSAIPASGEDLELLFEQLGVSLPGMAASPTLRGRSL